MRYYVAGCGGMLGEAVHRVFAERGDTLKCTDIDLNAPWLESCDFRDFDAYARSVKDFAPVTLMAATPFVTTRSAQPSLFRSRASRPPSASPA